MALREFFNAPMPILMKEPNHNEQNLKLNVSSAALLRKKFLAFGKNAADRFPVSLNSILHFSFLLAGCGKNKEATRDRNQVAMTNSAV